MSDSDEKAEDYAVAHHTYDYLSSDENAYYTSGFIRGARWQREALLSEESIERAALGIQASHDRGDWDEELPVVQDEYRDMARAALTAAMGEDEK